MANVRVGDVVEVKTWLGKRLRGVFYASCVSHFRNGRRVAFMVLDTGLVRVRGSRPKYAVVGHSPSGASDLAASGAAMAQAHAHQECLRRQTVHRFEACRGWA